jgi:hypothetical protein
MTRDGFCFCSVDIFDNFGFFPKLKTLSEVDECDVEQCIKLLTLLKYESQKLPQVHTCSLFDDFSAITTLQ